MPKKPAQTIIGLFKALSLEEQEPLVMTLANIFVDEKVKRLKALSEEVERLVMKKEPAKKTRVKPEPRYRSKKDKSLTWSGRGSVPRWMREEMKASKLKPGAFLIAKRK